MSSQAAQQHLVLCAALPAPHHPLHSVRSTSPFPRQADSPFHALGSLPLFKTPSPAPDAELVEMQLAQAAALPASLGPPPLPEPTAAPVEEAVSSSRLAGLDAGPGAGSLGTCCAWDCAGAAPQLQAGAAQLEPAQLARAECLLALSADLRLQQQGALQQLPGCALPGKQVCQRCGSAAEQQGAEAAGGPGSGLGLQLAPQLQQGAPPQLGGGAVQSPPQSVPQQHGGSAAGAAAVQRPAGAGVAPVSQLGRVLRLQGALKLQVELQQLLHSSIKVGGSRCCFVEHLTGAKRPIKCPICGARHTKN
jgi:hypothetical protein